MKIAVINHSTENSLAPPILEQMVAAVQLQICEHYTDLWQSGPVDIRVTTMEGALIDEDIIAVFDNADQAGVLGYHDVTPSGSPYGKVFVRPILDNEGTLIQGPNSISVTLSHEVLEMIGDPYVNFWADGPDGKEFALELGDAVEGDSYDIDGVSVSNFIGPRWFNQNGPGPYDWMKKLSKPFTMTQGGYLIVRENGNVKQIFGSRFPAWKLAGKSHAAARSMRRK